MGLVARKAFATLPTGTVNKTGAYPFPFAHPRNTLTENHDGSDPLMTQHNRKSTGQFVIAFPEMEIRMA